MNRDSGQDRIGEVGRRPERDTYEKVEKKLGPQKALRGAVRKRKQNRCDHDCDWAAKLAFERNLEISTILPLRRRCLLPC